MTNTPPMLARLSVFQLAPGSSQFLRSYPAPALQFQSNTNILADTDSSYYALPSASRSSYRITRFQMDGEPLAEFGIPLHKDPKWAGWENRGFLVSGVNRRLVFIGRTHPIVEIYDSNHELLNTRKLIYPEMLSRLSLPNPQDVDKDALPSLVGTAIGIRELEMVALILPPTPDYPMTVYGLSTITLEDTFRWETDILLPTADELKTGHFPQMVVARAAAIWFPSGLDGGASIYILDALNGRIVVFETDTIGDVG